MVVRTREISADTVTPIGVYAAVAQARGSCLLESAAPGGSLSRYSFVGLDYARTATFEASPRMYDAIRAFLAPYASLRESGSLAGALVAFAYDAARPMAGLANRAQDTPAMPHAYVAVPATWLIFDHYRHTLELWGFGESESDIDERLRVHETRILERAAPQAGSVHADGVVGASVDRERYLALVARAKQHIVDGDIYQIQLGVRFDAALRGAPFDVYRALRRANPSPYMFYVDAPFGVLLGASPEFLVRLDGRKARIRPLAGTRPRGNDRSEDERIARELLADEKERAEHVMLVDLARNDLGSVCEFGSVRVDELLAIERYSHVMHIVSDVTGTLRDDVDGLDLFRAGFPAGTVSGTPKVRAMQIIDELEPVTRGFYAGSIGKWNWNGDFDSCITLRSMQVVGERISWQASAGIVADSVPDAEYREVLHKTRIARAVLQLDEADV